MLRPCSRSPPTLPCGSRMRVDGGSFAGTWAYSTERDGGDGRARLGRLFTIVDAAGESVRSPLLDLAIWDWARRDEAVAERLRRVDNRRMDYLRSLFATFCPDPDDVEVRCMLTFSVRIGAYVVGADHPGRSRADVMKLAGEWLLR
jgi:hypothetical protein